MGLAQIRTELHALIDRSDARLLQMMYAMASAYDQEEIVAYTTSGKPLSKDAYRNAVKAGERDILSGNTITSTELKNRISSWKQKYSK